MMFFMYSTSTFLILHTMHDTFCDLSFIYIALSLIAVGNSYWWEWLS